MDDLITDYYNKLNPERFDGCESKTARSHSCLDCFKNQFFDGNKISYDCEEKRKLYLLRYFFVHSMENYHGAKSIPCDVIDGWFENGHVDILSIGGGPGSDVCGVLEYLEEEAKTRQVNLSINVVRLDIEDQWDEAFKDVMERFFPSANYRTVHLDANEGFETISDESFDLATASYLTSELSTEKCLNLANEIDSILVDGGVLMINDRPEGIVEQNIRSMFDQIKLIYKEQSLNGWAGYSYPNDIAAAVAPKFKMKSSMFYGVKR